MLGNCDFQLMECCSFVEIEYFKYCDSFKSGCTDALVGYVCSEYNINNVLKDRGTSSCLIHSESFERDNVDLIATSICNESSLFELFL
jgi:hypothetical protein